MVEQSAVNRSVVGSSPTFGAIRLGPSRTQGLAHGGPFQEGRVEWPRASAARRGARDIIRDVKYYVYILRLSNAQLYVGSTGDLARRLAEHQAGSGCRITALFRPVELAYSEVHSDRSSAVKRERQFKRRSRAKKLALINGDSAELKRLAQCHSTLLTAGY